MQKEDVHSMNERIKSVRKQSQLTQEQFAKRIGITGGALSLIESGKSNPSNQTVLLICHEFEVSEAWLRTGSGAMFLHSSSGLTERIKQVRLSLNLSQEKFGKMVGLTQNYIWMIEKRSRVPSERTIAGICREFGVSESWLRTGVGEMFQEKREPFQARLISALSCLSDEEWKVLEEIVSKIR